MTNSGGPKGGPTLGLKFGAPATTFALGLRKKSGEYFRPPQSAGSFAWGASGRNVKLGGGREVRAGLQASELAEVGWGVLWASEAIKAQVKPLLGPLLDLRRDEAGDLFKEYTYQPGQTVTSFLAGTNGVPGPVDPENSAPYYLLLVGDPEVLPFSFQQALDLRYATGRLSFERDEDYARYAQSVAESENGEHRLTRRAAFFGVEHQGDPVTAQCNAQLIGPLADEIARREGWSAEQVLGSAATQKALVNLLSCTNRPPVLVTAGHSPVLDKDDEKEQRELHGGIVTADWVEGPVDSKHVFGPANLPENLDLRSMVVVLVGCFSGGTPRYDPVAQGTPIELANTPFVGRLAQAMLARGVLATVAHVDSLYLHSFVWPGSKERPQHQTYGDMLHNLMSGQRLGDAMDTFGRRYGELAAHLMAARLEPQSYTEEQYSAYWIGYHDARQFVVLGDPAVRLSLPKEEPKT